MRKWLCFGIVTIAAGCFGGYWLCSKSISIPPLANRIQQLHGGAKDDGDAETSDTIEPLVVDRGGGATIQLIPPAQDERMPRVVFSPGMLQPPRPDVGPGHAARMPYADEEEILAVPLDPVARILEAPRPLANVLEGLNLGPGLYLEPEESEPKLEPPLLDYHRMQPHCPFPYYRR